MKSEPVAALQVFYLADEKDPSKMNVQVVGPFDDPILCYGLLGIARHKVQQYQEKKEAAHAASGIITTPDLPGQG